MNACVTFHSQVIIYSRNSELLPVLIKVQQLQRRLIDKPDAFGTVASEIRPLCKPTPFNVRPASSTLIMTAEPEFP